MPKKKTRGQIWDETPFKLGVWIHKKSKKIALAVEDPEKKMDWLICKGVKKQHPIFNYKQILSKAGTGNYFFHRELNQYEFYCSEIKDFIPGKVLSVGKL